MNIRNIAIIAHVDHGKTTLVDKMIYACNAIDDRKETKELILDNNDLEKERGITILSKNVSVTYKNHKINIIRLLSFFINTEFRFFVVLSSSCYVLFILVRIISDIKHFSHFCYPF